MLQCTALCSYVNISMDNSLELGQRVNTFEILISLSQWCFKKIYDLYSPLLWWPLLHLFAEGGIPAQQLWGQSNTWHQSPDWWDQMRSIDIFTTYIHSSGEKDATCHIGPHRVAFGNRVNSQELWKAGFVVIRGSDASWSPTPIPPQREDVVGLSAPFCRLAEHQSLTLRNEQELHLVPMIRRVVCIADLFQGSRVGRQTLGQVIQGHPSFPQISRQHIILDLNFRSYSKPP